MSPERRTVHPRVVLSAAAASAAGMAAAGPSIGSVAPLSAATVRMRRKFFGAANLDGGGRPRRDRVVLSWFGVTSFAMTMGGEVFLLDAWIPRGEYSGYVPTTPDELVALRPSHILIGHAHFDHAGDAPHVAAHSGAVVVGTPEQCAQVKQQSAGAARVRPLGSAGDPAGSRTALTLAGQVRVESIRHLHSAPKQPTGANMPLLPPPDITPCLEQPPSPSDSLHELSHLADQEGGTMLYRLSFRQFSLVWHDSSGPIASDAPQVLTALRRMRRPNVQIGSIQGFGQYTNGLRDPMHYIEAARPRVFVPAHHDNWAPPATANGASYEGPLREALGQMGEWAPQLRMLRDPEDYISPGRLTFRVRETAV